MIRRFRHRSTRPAVASLAAALSALILLQAVIGPLAARAATLETGRIVLCGGGLLWSVDADGAERQAHATPCPAAALDAGVAADALAFVASHPIGVAPGSRAQTLLFAAARAHRARAPPFHRA